MPTGQQWDGTFCAGQTGIDMAQAFIVPSYAHSFAKGRYSLGISPIFAAQTFKANDLRVLALFPVILSICLIPVETIPLGGFQGGGRPSCYLAYDWGLLIKVVFT